VSSEALAMAIIIVIHLIGLGVLIWWAMKADDDFNWREWWPDDGGGDERPQAGSPRPGPDGLPLPDAAQSASRLREPGRIGDWRRHRRETPAHVPARTPTRN
jgi:hypothetical protein